MNKFQTNGLLLMLAPLFVISSDLLVTKFTTHAAVGQINKKNVTEEKFSLTKRYFNTEFKKFPVDK